MKYTPYSIKNQDFNKSVRGYDKDEVQAFLEKLADEFERLQFDNEKLSKDNEELKNRIHDFRKIEKNLQSTLLSAQESSSKAVESAKKQTQLILKEGEYKATQIIDNAKTEAEKIRNSVLKLREEKQLLVARLKVMIESQSSLLDLDLQDDNNVKSEPTPNKIENTEQNSKIDVDDIFGEIIMSKILEMINETLEIIRNKTQDNYEIGIVLGTGLGGLVKDIEIEHEIEYADLPHFPLSTVESHKGKLILGKINGKNVVAMQGRFHYYEGYSMQQITYPIRVMKFLGVKNLLVSNACGGMNPLYKRGDIMLMVDHINLLGDNPLIGSNENELGPRFPDMSEPYSLGLIKLAEEAALENKIQLQKGVYVAVSGPNLETRAEYRFLRNIGADVVGMSTVPENIVAVHMGINVLGLSIVTDECFPEALQPVNVEEIIAAAMKAEPKMTTVMKEVIRKL